MRKVTALVLLLVALGAGAKASPLQAGASQTAASTHISIEPSGPRAAVPQPSAIEAAVLPQRSIDRRLGRQGPVGSAGFLCGRQAGVDTGGAASAAGYDPHGRFLGAKLSFAF